MPEGVLPTGPQVLTNQSSDDLLNAARADAYASLRAAQPGVHTMPNPGIRNTNVSVSAPAEQILPQAEAPPPLESFQDAVVAAPPVQTLQDVPKPTAQKGWTAGNQVRKLANRGGQVLSDMTIGFADTVADASPDWLNSGIYWYDGALHFTTGKESDEHSFVSNVADVLRDDSRQIVENRDSWTTQDIKDAWASGDKKEASSRAAVFALENGIASAPDMVAAVYAAPLYFAGLASHYTQARAQNDGRTKPNGKDVVVGTATAGMDFLLERYGADKVLGVMKSGKGAFRDFFKASLAEGATEAAQNPLEEVGQKMGTKAEGDLTYENLRDQAFFGGISGIGGAVGIGAPVHAAQHVMAPAATSGTPGAPTPEPTQPTPGTEASNGSANPAPTPPASAPAEPIVVPPAAVASMPDAAPVAAAPAKVADEPTAEPIADIKAQLDDMRDAKTPRKGVYFSPANLEAHGGLEGVQALAGDAQVINNFDKKGGALVVPNHSEKVKAFNLRKKVSDMQQVIGQLTGAGTGKPNIPNAPVVQGVTPDGAVASESAVTPAEIPAKVAQVAAEGKTPVVTTAEQAVQRREEQAPKEKRVVKLANGKEAAVQIEEENDTEMKVRLLDDQGEPTKQVVSIDKNRPQPTAVEAKNPIEARTDKPVTIEGEANTEVAAKVAKPTTALESLPKVLETHEQQETPPPGLKRPASLRERQDNASAFAQVLSAAAKESDAAPEILARAVRAAKQAEGLTLKSKEATEKGQGTSHTRISAIVDEMHRAARQLMGKAKAGDEVAAVAPKAAALKNRLTKSVEDATVRQTSPTTSAAKGSQESQEKIEVPVNEKYRNQVKRTPTASEQANARRMMDEYTRAEDKDAVPLREKIRVFMHEVKPDASKEEIDEVMQFLDSQRAELNADARPKRPKKMSETLEDDESVYDPDPNSGMSKVSRPTLAEQIKAKVFKNRATKMWDDAHDALVKSGFWQKAAALAKNGQHIGAHFVLDQVIKDAKDPVLSSMLMKLRKHVPDVPVHFVGKVKKFQNGEVVNDKGAGLFNPRTGQIQVALEGPNGVNTYTTRSLVHELVHAATEYELKENPLGSLALRIDGLRKIALSQITKRGEKVAVNVPAHMAYFEGTGPKPLNFNRQIYGLTNASEFMTEAMTNPEFQKMLAMSDGSKLGAVEQPSLLTRLFRTIAKWMGFDNPTLLDHVAETTQKIMEAQNVDAAHLYSKSSEEFFAAMPDRYKELFAPDRLAFEQNEDGIRAMFEEPKKITGEGELSAIAGEEATKVARAFQHVIRSKAWHALRKTGIAFLSADQLFRGNRRFFGSETDSANPLIQLEEAGIEKNKQLNKMMDRARPVAEKRLQLDGLADKALGQMQIDTTMWKIDPTLAKADQAAVAKDFPKFDQRYDEYVARFKKLPPLAQQVYVEERDYNRWAVRELRKAGVDVALQSYGADQISDAQRRLLYSARSPHEFESIIGGPKKDGSLRPIDLGEELNKPLLAALKEFSGITENEGPYFHLGRQGEFVVHVTPEGERSFPNQAQAIEFAQRVHDLGPTSKAKIDHVGNEWVVKFKANYTSMHENASDAEADAQRMRDAGFGVGTVTQKTLSRENTPLGAGMKELAAEAERRINKQGEDEGSQALVQSLRSAFLQLQAARSAYAGSRLARKNVAGVKSQDMRRNFAEHAQSQAWHTSQLFSAFREAAALAKVRGAARSGDASQDVMYRRGRVVAEIGRRMTQEVRDYGIKTPANATIAKLGFMAYLASPAHALVNMTQNFTSGIPVAAARWGTRRSVAEFARAMTLVTGPAFRSSMKAVFSRGGTATQVHNAIIDAVRKHPTLGKWAKGENSPLQQLIDRGVISHSYSNELASVATGDSARVARVFEWARLTPNMADAFNRISSALAALELTKGDVRKTADFINETQVDYSQSNKPRAFKGLARVPGGNALTMFKTYPQAMAHLLYSNLLASFKGQRKAEAAKTFAGLVLANVIFAGLFKGAALEPLRLIAYAWNKLFGDDDEYYNMQNSIHTFLVEHMGKTAGNALAYGAPNLIGADVSGRMGLSDLFLHDPPDLLTADKTAWSQFMFENVGGPPAQLLANNVTTFNSKMDQGEPYEAVSSIIPVKMYQDTVKAYELATTGKTNSLGAQVTEPSGSDALYQMMGFRPASVAKYQEKVQTSIERQKFLDARKNAIVREYLHADDKSSVLEKVAKFNEKNPGAALTVGDFLKLQRAKQRAEAQAEGGPNRDPALNEMLDY